MSTTQLVIGNRATSAWSMAAWLALKQTDLENEDLVLNQYEPEGRAAIKDYSPSGILPVLVASNVKIWDALSIIEFLAELAPTLWPTDPWHRSQARSICAELRSGFTAMKHFMPMDCTSRFNPPGKSLSAVNTDVARLLDIITVYRTKSSSNGDFLFGPFCGADVMMAPFVSRLHTYSLPVTGLVEDYCNAVQRQRHFRNWVELAISEKNSNTGPVYHSPTTGLHRGDETNDADLTRRLTEFDKPPPLVTEPASGPIPTAPLPAAAPATPQQAASQSAFREQEPPARANPLLNDAPPVYQEPPANQKLPMNEEPPVYQEQPVHQQAQDEQPVHKSPSFAEWQKKSSTDTQPAQATDEPLQEDHGPAEPALFRRQKTPTEARPKVSQGVSVKPIGDGIRRRR